MGKKDLRDIKYIKDPEFFFEKIKKREPFALVRVGDRGIEAHLMGNEKWGEVDKSLNHDFLDSLIYREEGYYIGMLFNKKIGKHFLYFTIPLSVIRQDDKYLTDAHIFSHFKEDNRLKFMDWFFDMVESDDDMKINWICNKLVEKTSPKFIDKFFFIGGACWRRRCDKIKSEILNYIDTVENELFMFSASSFANILIHNAWMRNKKNTYIDIGTVFDPFYEPAYETRGLITEELKIRKKRWDKLK